MPTDYERKYREKYFEHDTLVEEILGVTQVINLHVAPYSLRGWKSPEEQNLILKGLGYFHFDPTSMPLKIQEALLEDLDPGLNGTFVFEPNRIYLAYTAESVTIPGNQQWRMRSFFTLDDCWPLSLTTNIGAPVLKPHSKGPQTYEIRNFGPEPLAVPLNRLTCTTAIIPVHPVEGPSNGIFSVQSGQRPRLGKV